MIEDPETAALEQKKPVTDRLLDFVFGYDFFVSYCWADGREYAVALVQKLREQGFECFLDSSDYAKGDNWRDQGRRALKKTSRLILVGTPKALESEPVMNELAIFHRLGRHILPIDIDGTLAQAAVDSPVTRHLSPEILSIKEKREALAKGPTTATIQALCNTMGLVRQQQKRLRLLTGAVLAFASIALIATLFFALADHRQRQATAMAWTAEGESIFEAYPLEGLRLVQSGLEQLPYWSDALHKRLAARLLRLANHGRLQRLASDLLGAELTDDGKLFIARRYVDGELRNAADLSLSETLHPRIQRVFADKGGDYLVLENARTVMDQNFAYRRRSDGVPIGYRKQFGGSAPVLFPEREPRYFYDDTGLSPTIVRLSDLAKIGHSGFDIAHFQHEQWWPMFAISYEDNDDGGELPPDSELFDLHSGQLVHRFATRWIKSHETKSRVYRVINFIGADDDIEQATVYVNDAGYVIAAGDGYGLWHLGRQLPLPTLPENLFSGTIDGRPYLLLSYPERSELWSLNDQRMLDEFPPISTAEFIDGLAGWLLMPKSPDAPSSILQWRGEQFVLTELEARISQKTGRADAQGRYFTTRNGDGNWQLRHTSDGSLVPLSAAVTQFQFPNDADTPLFAVHYRGVRPSEIRRIADASLVQTLTNKGRVKVRFKGGDYFLINYYESPDPERDADYRSELRSSREANLVLSEADGVEDYNVGPGGELLLLERRDGDVEVMLKSDSGYRKVTGRMTEEMRRVVFHPDPAARSFITIAERKTSRGGAFSSINLYRVVEDDTVPGTLKIHHVNQQEIIADTAEFFDIDGRDYLLMANGGEQLQLWRVDGAPWKIFEAPIGLAGFRKLPGPGRLLLWYDDGRAHVIDVRLLDLAASAADGGEDELQTLFEYLESALFDSHWLNQEFLSKREAALQLE